MKNKLFAVSSFAISLLYASNVLADKLLTEITLDKTPAHMTISQTTGTVFISDANSHVIHLFSEKGSQKLYFHSPNTVKVSRLEWHSGINQLQIERNQWLSLYDYDPNMGQYPYLNSYYKSPSATIAEEFAGTTYKVQKIVSAKINQQHFGYILVSTEPNKKDYAQGLTKDIHIYRYDSATGGNLQRIFTHKAVAPNESTSHASDLLYNPKKNQLIFIASAPAVNGSYEKGWLGAYGLQLNQEGNVVRGGFAYKQANWDANIFQTKLALDHNKQILYFIFKNTNQPLFSLDLNKGASWQALNIPVKAKFTDLGMDSSSGKIYLTENKSLHVLSKDKLEMWQDQKFPVPQGNHVIDFDATEKVTYVLTPEAKRLTIFEHHP